MPTKPRSLSRDEAPDPSDVYERSHPENESGMGRLSTNAKATPAKSADRMAGAVKHAQDGSKQLNAHDDLQLPQSPAKKPKTGNTKTEGVGWDPKKKKKPR